MNTRIIYWVILASLLVSANSRAQVPPDAVWIDVRSPAEYAQANLAQAQLIPYDGIEAGVAALALSSETPIYLYCAVGGRAELARARLQNVGYSNVTNVGGLEDALLLAAEQEQTKRP